jgi:diguanylate cyclase (GGDEF)-like protein
MNAEKATDRKYPALALSVRDAQAASMLERLPATLATNAGISASALLTSSVDRGITLSALLWFAAVIITLALRLGANIAMRRWEITRKAPENTLRTMTFGAFVSGLTWAALPFSIPGFDPLGVDGSLYLLMCGMATGAVLMGIGHSPSSLGFALPVHMSVIATLAFSGTTSGPLLALNVLALTVVLYKSSRKGEAVVVSNIEAKLQATGLADSLSDANTDILLANDRLEVMANHDPLTGLANRTAFNAALAKGISDALAKGEQMALLILDLDRFKSINDTFGHSAGDALLTEISERLRTAIGNNGTIARLGGDEFAVILGGANATDRAPAHAEAILEHCRQPLFLDGQPIVIGTSIGLALFPDHASTAEDLFICADMALYRAKDDGRRQWRRFDPAFRFKVDRQRQIEQELDHALATDQIEAWFQPQVDLRRQEIVGFEALVRWHHPYLGPIAPPEIVAAAQAANLSDRLTATMAAAACRLLNSLPMLGLPRATVAINVSPREFDLYSVGEVLDRVTRAHRIDPSLFEIEITEEAILDTLIAGEQLKHIERSGYKLAVDDFGAGHSSLAYLVGLKVDRLKLDRRFITGIQDSRQNQEIVGAMIGLGRALSMEVVAEGIENEEELQALNALGCAIGQGYHLGRPMPAQRIPGWIDNRRMLANRHVA